ncbi:MAG: hypothetical protein ACKPEO_18530 [Sphaerospermopsis kisseleviana]
MKIYLLSPGKYDYTETHDEAPNVKILYQDVYIFMGKKYDIKQIDAIAREFSMSEKLRKAFGKFIEIEKRNGYGGTLNDRGDFTYQELRQKAKEFLEDIDYDS